MADNSASFDWDSYLASAPSPGAVSAARPSQGYDWNSHLSSVVSPQDSVAKAATPQLSGPSRLPLLGAKALGQGAAALIAVPGDLEALLPAPPPPIPGLTWKFPSSADLAPITNALGITGTPQLTPQSQGEKFGTAAIQALPAAAASIATGGAPLASLGAAEAGALSGEGAHQLFPESRWAPVVAGLISGLGFGSAAGWLERSNTAKSAARKLTTAEAELDRASDAKFYGTQDAETATQSIISASKDKLGSIEDLAGASVEAAKKEAGADTEAVAAQLGTSSTLQQAGSILQDSARDWIGNKLPEKLAAVWAPVRAAIPGTLQLPLSEFSKTVGQINSSAGALEPLAALMKPKLPAQLGKVLDGKADLQELTAEPGDSPAEPTYSWKDVSALRSTLGDALSNPQVIKDLGSKNTSALYRALTMDMRVGADRAGAVPLFDSANAESTRLYNLAEGPMAKIVSGARASADDPLPETVARRLLTGGKSGASDLAIVASELPEAAPELAAAGIRTGVWSKLSPEARAALVPNQGHQAALDGALLKQVSASQQAKAAVAQARQDHADTVSAANQARDSGNFSRAEAVRKSQKAVAEARAKLPPPIPPIQNVAHTMSSAFGGVFGHELAPTILNHAGLEVNPLMTAVVTAAGLGLPLAARGAKAALQNPGSARLPLTAAAAANNPFQLESVVSPSK